MTSLLLFNPKEQPYGVLSPLYDDIVSKSYVELIKDINIKKSILNEDEKNARKYSLEIFENQNHEQYVSFLKKGLDIKYREDSLRKDLLSIKNKYIIYDSNNDFLGVKYNGSSYIGNNFIGKYLMEIRKKLQQEEKEKQELFINKVYSLYETLKAEFINAENDLEMYLNKSIDEVFSIRALENKPIKIMYYKQDSEIAYFLNLPESISTVIRCCHLAEYNYSLKEKIKEKTIEDIKNELIIYYLESKLKLSGEMMKKIIINLSQKNHIEPLKERLIRLYNLGLLPDFKFSKDIKDIKELIVNQDECKSFHEYMKTYKKLDEYITNNPKKVENIADLYIIKENTDKHCPFYEIMMKDIYVYYNIQQYVIKNLLDSFGVIDSYQKIKDQSNVELGNIYQHYKNKFLYDTVIMKAKELIDLKYKKEFDYKLLLSTRQKYKDIIFDDKEDFILGNGFNFVGKYLMDKREELYKQYGDIDYKMSVTIEKENKLNDLLKDEKIRTFSLQKTKDLFEMLKLFQKYNKKYSDKYSYIEAFQFIFKNFLDCIHQIKLEDFNKSLVPIEFKKQFNVSKDCIEELWMYCYYIYKISSKLEKDLPLFDIMEKLRKIKSLKSLKDISLLPFDMFDSFAKKASNVEVSKETNKSTRFDKKLLTEETSIDFTKFYTNEESQYSSLLPKHVKQVERVFKDWFFNVIEKDILIIDATSHIGVDSIHFANMFTNSKIHSYEINKNTFDLLEKNIKVFSKQQQIEAFNKSFLNASIDNAYFIYIDAPWGGKSYKETAMGKFELYLDNINIKEITRRLLVNKKTKAVVLKVPFNYNFSDLNNFSIERAEIKDKTKTSFVLLRITMSDLELQKPLMRSLCVSSFLNIFDTIKAFDSTFVLNENTIHFAFKLLYLSNKDVNIHEKIKLSLQDKKVEGKLDSNIEFLLKTKDYTEEKLEKVVNKLPMFKEKEIIYNFYYQEILLSYFMDDDIKKYKETIILSSIFEQYIEYIINNPIKVENIISRLLLFKSSKKVSFKQSMKEPDQPLYELEDELEDEELNPFDFSDEELEEEPESENDDQEPEQEEEDMGADYDYEEQDDEFGNQDD